MSHFVTLCFEIKEIVGGRVHLDRNTFLYLKTKTAESVDFFWIVSQKPKSLAAKVAQDLRSDVVFAHIARKSQSQICFERIIPLS